MANCSKDTNGSQFNFQKPCQRLMVVKILMVHSLIFRNLVTNCGKDTNSSQFNFQESCQRLIVVKILMVQFNFQEPCQWLIVVKILMGHSLIFRKLVNG